MPGSTDIDALLTPKADVRPMAARGQSDRCDFSAVPSEIAKSAQLRTVFEKALTITTPRRIRPMPTIAARSSF